uniref:Calcium uptake protein 3, mitochondrial n=1 Tax=Phallusia mammillata TaxID=59560 RepID=A0A6F9DLP3_9ASCI|nr:calcium uptake protein 3, mitochondrial [Phallusia mammillata]
MAFRKTVRLAFANASAMLVSPTMSKSAGRVALVCTACGSALLAYSIHQQRKLEITQRTFPMTTLVSCDGPSPMAKNEAVARPNRDVYQHLREKRFHDFASVEVSGEFFMTPQDFLESVTDEQPRPRIGHMRLAESDVKTMLGKTPNQNKNTSRFFRSLHSNGLISYTEYLFLLCILTKPKMGFEIAFNMFDVDGNRRVDKKEFLVLEEIFRSRTEKQCYDEQGRDRFRRVVKDWNSDDSSLTLRESESNVQDTTLLVHFFGKNGKDDLRFDDFYQFMDNLQTEVLEMEFLAYSHGMATISETEFARVLLRFTELDDIEEQIEKVTERIQEEKGISFEEFRSFFQFLNNLEDFAIAMQMYTLAGRAIGQDEFKRAVKISTGHELSENLVNTLFQIFDKDGDNKLSHVEFMGVMKDRIQRGFRKQGVVRKFRGFKGMRRCMSAETRVFIRDLATHSQGNKYFL